MLAIEERHVLYDLLAIKEGVEKVDEQVLVGNSAEDALETEIGQQTDISFFWISHNFDFFTKVWDLYDNGKFWRENPRETLNTSFFIHV